MKIKEMEIRKNILSILIFSLLLVLIGPGFGQVNGKSLLMPLEEVKPGMQGTGKSVFKGEKADEFSVEIIGIIRNFQPKKNLILARLKGEVVNKAGVVNGMSGSPVYVGGKLIGAIAYSFPYAKEAVAGITPIEEMLPVSETKHSEKSSFSKKIPVKRSLSLEEIFRLHQDFFSSRAASFAEGHAFQPLSLPLVFSGFPADIFERAKPLFSKLGFNPIRSGSLGQQKPSVIKPQELTLREGDCVGVELVSGDLSVAAVGTVTYVDGNKILAFGHPIYNMGDVDYAMTRAEVLTVVPSISSSFKISNTGMTIGRFSQDRSTGVFGELGKMPRFLPLNIQIKGPEEEVRTYTIKLVNDKILTAVYLNLALSSVLASEARSYGDLSLALSGTIFLENGKNIRLEDLYSGNFNTASTDLANLVTAVVYFLSNNEFEDLSIHRIDLRIQSLEEAKFAYLERVWLERYEASPGETIRIKIYARTFRGESVKREVGIPAPLLPAGSEYQILIGDAQAMARMEMSLYRTAGFVPRSLNQLLRSLNNLRKNNRIYFKMLTSRPGLFLKGEELPNLPPSLKEMFSSPRASASAPVELNRSTLREYQLPVPYVFQGSALIPLKIKK